MIKQFTQQEIISKYGKADREGRYLTSINLPFELIISWDKRKKITVLKCHRMEAQNLSNIFTDLLNHYGPSEINRLGINLYGGCFSYRLMTSGTILSRHSWGVALDLDPERNSFHASHKTARFAQPEYAPMINIFEQHGWFNLGKRIDKDWMHFEAGDGKVESNIKFNTPFNTTTKNQSPIIKNSFLDI